MKIFWKVFGQSFVATFSRAATWIIVLSCILMNAVFISIVPTLMKNTDTWKDADIWMISIMSHMIGVVTIGFFSSVLGEIVANPSDRIFILARSVKRESYLAAKILLSVLIASVLAGIASIFYWELDKRVLDIPDDPTYVDAYKLSMTMFVLGIFGASCGTTMRYYLREMLISVVILVITLSYAVAFAFINNSAGEDVLATNDWQFFKIPLYVFLPLTACVLFTGFMLNHKVDIGV